MRNETRNAKVDNILPGYERQWVECKKCKSVSYYDYIPYSLSSCAHTLPCHHGINLPLRDSTNLISEAAALKRIGGEG